MRTMPSAARNVLLITSDQQHWNTLGCLDPEVRTPNLDRLAAQGALFTRADCPNPTLYADPRLDHHREVPEPAR